jgi:hypothetical protein
MGWAELIEDEERGGCRMPMIRLDHEPDKDSRMRADPISPEKREDVIAYLAAGPLGAYQYLREEREVIASNMFALESRHSTSQDRAEPSVSVLLREETQEVLRRRDRELSTSRGSGTPGADPRCDR